MLRMLIACFALLAFAATSAEARTEKIVVRAPSIEGNLEGNSPDRTVLVYLPPSYDSDANRRFPVVYFLHGFSVSAEDYARYNRFEEMVNAAFASGNEMIVVLPDAFTLRKGSFYSSGPVVGDFESFIAEDLVQQIDGRYRTLAKPEARGISGHSMGGYGAFKIGMRHPDTFRAIYAMSACCLSPRTWTADELRRLSTMSAEEQQAANIGDSATLAMLAAWVPAPENASTYFDALKDGEVDVLTQARIHANSPLVMLSQHITGLRAMKAIAFDVGNQDVLVSENTRMHEELERFGVEHRFEIYEGNHVNRVPERIQTLVLPFFKAHLESR